MSNLRKILFAIAAFGGAATAIGAGTFASFSASTTNGGNTFATGTLVLSDQKNTTTACLSTGAGTNTDTNTNASCDQLFSTSVAKPGDSAYVDVTLSNAGSINASALTAYRSAACATTSVGTYSGGGDLCAGLQMYVQEYASATDRTNNTTTGGTCLYGVGTTACAFDATKTVAGFPASGTPISMGALTAGANRYLRIYVQIPSSAGNDVQGRQAAFGFTWALAQ